MKALQKEDIDKVAPKFRPMVLEAWNRGEEVPESVTLLSDSPLTKEDIRWAKAIIDEHE